MNVTKDTTDVIADLKAYSRLAGFPPVLETAAAELDRLYDSGNAAALAIQKANLSKRQEEVLRLMAKGYSYKEIAKLLDMAPGTAANPPRPGHEPKPPKDVTRPRRPR